MTQLITDGIDTAVVKLMELDDLTGPVATEFCNLLNQMADEFRNQGTDRAADALVDCVEKINPESDYSQAVKQISKTLSCLQELTIHGKAIEEITFPNEGSESGETVCKHVDAPAPDSDELPDLSDVVDQLNADETSEETNESNDSSSIDKIDLAVMKLMEVDSFDSPEANELTELLNDLSDVFQQSDAMRATVALNMCIGGIAANENFQKVIQQISKTLSCLQDYKIHGKSLDEITFPNEELSTSESDSVAEVSADLEEMEQLAAQLTEADDTPVAASNDNTVGVNGKSDPVLFEGDPELLKLFIQDATEHLENVEADLLVLENDPTNFESLDSAFRSFHSVKGSAGFANLTPIEKIAHAMEEMLDLARDGKLTLQEKMMDLILATLDTIRCWVGRVQESVQGKKPLLFTSEGEEFIQVIRSVVEGKIQADDIVVPEKMSDRMKNNSNSSDKENSKSNSSTQTDAIRVDRDRLDQLIDLIGELVITESMVNAEFDEIQHENVEGESLPQLRKITRELQMLSLSLRMMSINGLFQKGNRIIRDLARKLDKDINLQIEGEETELDKRILDELSDPLVHIIRNAVDHGIESTSEERVAAGKPAKATISLRAFYKGGNIYVEIEDDGRGLDKDKLLFRAIERGIVAPDAELTDDEIHQLIFAPGFSTAEQVTEVSGRGVGMDVVRRNIEAARGSVHIDSELGKGTCISLRLPLTLAIIDGMVVNVHGQRYIIPTLSIVNQFQPEPEALSTVNGCGDIVEFHGHNVPFHRLSRVFSLEGEEKAVTESIVIVIEEKDRLSGLLVDDIVGQQQVVIKSIGSRNLSDSSMEIAGAAVMPDGEVALILDIHSVLELARGEQANQ